MTASITSVKIHSIVKAFEDACVGSRINHARIGNAPDFFGLIVDAINDYEVDGMTPKVPGQYLIQLPPEACNMVISGVGKHTNDPYDYVVREWRGHCGMFLRRKHAVPCTNVSVVVYTKEALLADPETTPEEAEEYKDATHIIIAVLASAGPNPKPSAWTFVRNMAFANNEEQRATADELRAKAKEIYEFNSEWCTVAD